MFWNSRQPVDHYRSSTLIVCHLHSGCPRWWLNQRSFFEASPKPKVMKPGYTSEVQQHQLLLYFRKPYGIWYFCTSIPFNLEDTSFVYRGLTEFSATHSRGLKYNAIEPNSDVRPIIPFNISTPCYYPSLLLLVRPPIDFQSMQIVAKNESKLAEEKRHPLFVSAGWTDSLSKYNNCINGKK